MKTSNKFRLFKRADDGREMPPAAAGYKERFYYFRFTYRGKAYPRCLETNDAAEAQRRAKAKYTEIIAAVSAGSYARLDATKLRTGSNTTLEQIYTAYRSGPAEANATTRELNINALKQIAGTATAVRELTPTVARQWFEAVQLAVLNCVDQEAAASLKRSANSRWTQAKSIFIPRCLAHYQDQDLLPAGKSGLAGIEAFVNAGDNARFNRIPKQNYNPPSETIIQKTLEAWEALGHGGTDTVSRDMFLAIGHELAFGLRKGEMEQARWNWHTVRAGYPVLDGRANVKNGSGLVQVRALDPFYSTMKRIATAKEWWPKNDGQSGTDLVIEGTDYYRTDEVYRKIGDWLRALGWATMKTNHALRAYVGSQVAMKYGIYEAQMFLRHSTVKVTEQNYSHFITKFKPADLATLPAKWAVVATAPLPDVTLEPNCEVPKDSATLRNLLPWVAPTTRN